MSALNDGRWQRVALHAAAVGAIALSLVWQRPVLTLVGGGLLCVVVYGALAVAEMRRAPLVLSPASFYFLWYAVGLGCSAVYAGYLASVSVELSFGISGLAVDDVAVGYVIFLVGSVALHAGLQVARPVVTRQEHTGRFSLVGLTALWLIGLTALWISDRLGFLGSLRGAMDWAALGAVSALALGTPMSGRRRPSFPVLLAIGTSGLFVANLMSYSKAYLMYSFLPLAWLILAERRLRRWIPAAGLGFLVLYLGVIAPVVTEARNTLSDSTSSPAERLADTFLRGSWTPSAVVDPGWYWEQADALLRRHFDPTSVAYLYSEVQTYGFRRGETLGYARYAFIPRLLWPNKPTVSQGAWFTVYTGFSDDERTATTATGITATGELYWNFGLPGVISGMFLIGILVGGLWRMAGADPRRSLLAMWLYVLVMVSMPNMSEFVTVVTSVVSTFLIFKALSSLSGALRDLEQRFNVRFA